MDRNQMAEVYDRLKNTVYRLALTYCRNVQDAEDITQEVFLALFDSDRSFPTDEAEKAWVIRVTMNKCKNLLKSFARSRSSSLEDADIPGQIMPDNSIYRAINKLPDKYRLVICLYYIEGCTAKEAAEIMSCSESSVRTMLHRARKKLKKYFE